ncbi:hypothetical protein CALVIDRAFT_555233 [Calocera viscosa TUFC12733]|uniref:Uncharacterized protein n=1 Tax=Calocera viscosa (strain TUFC12733) TaxID=1330018 RepID=A0A167LWV0_CALVF|nr:hypothetical protein CALVIDRAFT_555233 [Calocera viscosa TUFC12733]
MGRGRGDNGGSAAGAAYWSVGRKRGAKRTASVSSLPLSARRRSLPKLVSALNQIELQLPRPGVTAFFGVDEQRQRCFRPGESRNTHTRAGEGQRCGERLPRRCDNERGQSGGDVRDSRAGTLDVGTGNGFACSSCTYFHLNREDAGYRYGRSVYTKRSLPPSDARRYRTTSPSSRHTNSADTM